jgi:hypothetical protein
MVQLKMNCTSLQIVSTLSRVALHDKQQAAAVEIGQQRRFKPPLYALSGGW